MQQEQSPQTDVQAGPVPGPSEQALVDLEEFRITQPKVIGDVLRQLMNRKDFLTVECMDGSHRIVTSVLAVNQLDGFFVFDGSPINSHNRGLLDSPENFFSANQDGIRIQFTVNQPETDEFEGGFALRAALPQSLYRVQRREFYRAAAPLVESFRCKAVLPDGRELSWDIVDLSLDGLGLRSKDPISGELPMGTVLNQVVLDFGQRGRIETDLRITNLRNIRGPSNPVYRIGSRFEHFPKSKEQVLQRLITYLELTRRGRS